MTQDEIFNKTKQILVDEFEVDESAITKEANLFTDLELDSLDAIDLMVTLDKELGVEGETEQMTDLRTVQDVCDFIVASLDNE
jgi:acyl carrier protein